MEGTVRRTRPRRTGVAASIVALAVIGLGACSSSGGSDTASSTTAPAGVTTTATSGSGASTTTAPAATTTAPATTSTAPAGPSLVGTWTADAHDLLAANTANVHVPTAVDCNGPVNLTFGPRGRFVQTGTATCTVRGRSGVATYDSAGRWVLNGNRLTIAGVTSHSRITILGTTVPLGGGLFAGGADVSTSGTTLTITYTGPEVGTIVQTYTRA